MQNCSVAKAAASPANAARNLIINYPAGSGFHSGARLELRAGEISCLGHICGTFTAVNCIKGNAKGHTESIQNTHIHTGTDTPTHKGSYASRVTNTLTLYWQIQIECRERIHLTLHNVTYE